MIPLEFGWRDLLFANWPVDADAIAERLPRELAVQTFDGTGWLSIVPFVNVDIRPRWTPAAMGYTVPEVNLRTYVEQDGEPGIYFLSLDATSLLAVLGARITHHLPYFWARIDVERADGRYAVRSRRRHPGARPASFEATYAPRGEVYVPEAGSLAAFLTERRRLYTLGQDRTLRHTDVAHEPWALYDADVTLSAGSLFESNGFAHPTAEPTCYYSPGVDVVASASRRWAPPVDERRRLRR